LKSSSISSFSSPVSTLVSL